MSLVSSQCSELPPSPVDCEVSCTFSCGYAVTSFVALAAKMKCPCVFEFRGSKGMVVVLDSRIESRRLVLTVGAQDMIHMKMGRPFFSCTISHAQVKAIHSFTTRNEPFRIDVFGGEADDPQSMHKMVTSYFRNTGVVQCFSNLIDSHNDVIEVPDLSFSAPFEFAQHSFGGFIADLARSDVTLMTLWPHEGLLTFLGYNQQFNSSSVSCKIKTKVPYSSPDLQRVKEPKFALSHFTILNSISDFSSDVAVSFGLAPGADEVQCAKVVLPRTATMHIVAYLSRAMDEI